MSTLVIIDVGLYGSERSYNDLCLAMNLANREGAHLRVFLMIDGVQCALAKHTSPDGDAFFHCSQQ